MKRILTVGGILTIWFVSLLFAQQVYNGYYDYSTQSAPANPSSGRLRFFGNSTSGWLSCLTSTGVNCLIQNIPVSTIAQVLSGTYTSGITATGSTNQTCALTITGGGGSGATATVALTGSNAIAGGTALVITAPGTNFTSAPIAATVSNGSATCTGPAVIATKVTIPDNGAASVYAYNPSTTLTENLPVGVAGWQRCYRNATTITGVITIAVASSNNIDKDGVNGTTSTGTLVSGGAAGDAVCLVSDVANHWYAYVQKGTWTNN